MRKIWKKTAFMLATTATLVVAAPLVSLAQGCGERQCFDGGSQCYTAFSKWDWQDTSDKEACYKGKQLWYGFDGSYWNTYDQEERNCPFSQKSQTKDFWDWILSNDDWQSDLEQDDSTLPVEPSLPGMSEVPDISDSPVTEEDVTWNAQITAVVELVNQARAANGLSALTLNQELSAAAEIRAQETAVSFSHTRPDGSSCFTVMDQLGISYRYAAENIAYGYTDAQSVMTGWLNSSGHRQNIMSASAGQIGVGIYEDSDGTLYWVQLFMD